MTIYRADLTGEQYRLIAHLLPGDQLILAWTPGTQVIDGEPESPWIEVFNDDPIPRVCRYGTEARLTQNSRVRQRPPIVAAARAIRRGGVAYITHEQRQETDKFGNSYGVPVLLPAGHVLVEAERGDV